MNYHVYDDTTAWKSWIEYCEICYQLNVPEQPSITKYMRYREYLKEVGVL